MAIETMEMRIISMERSLKPYYMPVGLYANSTMCITLKKILVQSYLESFSLNTLNFSNSQNYSEPKLNTNNWELHLVQFQSLLLNTNARMYLYNTPRDTMAKDMLFHSLCSTSTQNARWIITNTSNSYFPCASELMLNTKNS